MGVEPEKLVSVTNFPGQMKLRLKDIELKLYVGQLPWEKRRLERILVTLEINVNFENNPPDYWKISKAIIEKFSKTRCEWLEDLALTMAKFLKSQFKIRGSLTLQKFPKVPQSPKVFETQVSL